MISDLFPATSENKQNSDGVRGGEDLIFVSSEPLKTNKIAAALRGGGSGGDFIFVSSEPLKTDKIAAARGGGLGMPLRALLLSRHALNMPHYRQKRIMIFILDTNAWYFYT